jgi:hypothetical protein
MKRACLLAAGLVIAGCTPGNYDLNINVNPPAVPSPGPSQSGGQGPLEPAAIAPGASATPTSPLPSGASPEPAPSASPRPTSKVDAAQETVSAYHQVGNGTRLAQTFKLKAGGAVAAIALRLKGSASDREAVLTINKLDTKDKPTAEVVATAKIKPAELPENGDWSTITLEAPLMVEAGARYAFILTFEGANSIYAGAGNDNSYQDGNGLTGLSTWNKLGQDLAFRVLLK